MKTNTSISIIIICIFCNSAVLFSQTSDCNTKAKCVFSTLTAKPWYFIQVKGAAWDPFYLPKPELFYIFREDSTISFKYTKHSSLDTSGRFYHTKFEIVEIMDFNSFKQYGVRIFNFSDDFEYVFSVEYDHKSNFYQLFKPYIKTKYIDYQFLINKEGMILRENTDKFENSIIKEFR